MTQRHSDTQTRTNVQYKQASKQTNTQRPERAWLADESEVIKCRLQGARVSKRQLRTKGKCEK